MHADESCFTHNSTHHRGRCPQRREWIVDTSTSPATGYMEMVDLKDAETVFSNMNSVVEPGS